MKQNDKKHLTAENGHPIADNQNTQTAGVRGVVTLQDPWLTEKLAHFDREVIPERRMHAKGSGAYGTFTVTHDITAYTRASIFSEVGKKTECFVRFSTVAGERGAADAERDIRGFAMKFYTDSGNWDLVGNNTPVFFLRDPLKFPDLNHAIKRDPRTGMRSANSNWDFWTLLPEALHQVTITMSPRGIPYSFRHMHGFGSHTYSFINADNQRTWVKFHLRTLQGIKNMTDAEAEAVIAKDRESHQRDLFEAIERGDYPRWLMQVQLMTEEQAKEYHINPFDLTKVWYHGDFPLHDVGYVDYVLFGGNGKPLAVVEAKRSSVSPIKGKHQAELYADCLEAQYGVRPVIYYTNGFETYIIDGLGYPPRRLYGFHTASDLELMIQQRSRKDISDFSVKDNITDRAYQKMAIKSVCEHLNKKHRKALLVMATGTGKTRVSISLVDVLMRNGWVKNVLFLADRTSLVGQAHKNFVKLLPSTTTCVLSDNGERDMNARITFSTYQTMINYIDTDDKPFSVGRFDLIIIDEAHRSIFGKYGAIFNYFDAMLVGLTATPRNEVDKSTYDIFEMEQGVPNYAYELEDAVSEGYLVNYRGFKRGSLILKEGIKYANLTDEEKKQMEAIWEYESAIKGMQKVFDERSSVRDIENKEIFNYIFNEATIDAVLQDLMENGQKVQYGERIGKSIIFAYNHRHAELIVERFNKLYPEYGSDFCVLIDNYVTYSQDLIDKFKIRDNNPQIAVSVDMLDTGIDVPDVLNLVFFKIVKSKIKFMQMIGRGTRLSADIFGNGKDKECFYIFDWCRNFEYFEKNPNGTAAPSTMSLTERIFGLRAEVAFHLQHQKYQEDDYCRGLHNELKETLKEQVMALSDSHISVRSKWEEVSHFKNEDNWLSLSEVDVHTLKNDIAPLLPKNTLEPTAKMFDALILFIELSYVGGEVNADKKIVQVQKVAEILVEKKATLPQVQAKMATLKEVLSVAAWENISMQWLEKVRNDLRELMQFLKGDKGRWFVVDIEDVITDDGESEGIKMKVSYKQRIIDFLANNRNLPVLKKIYNIEQLSAEDINELERILWSELGSKEDYAKYTQNMLFGGNVAAFIRSLIGVDRREALNKFSEFLSGNELNAEQEEFLNTIVQYVCENGDITKEIVVNEAPFDERLVLFTPYMIPLGKYIDNIHNVIIPQGGSGVYAS